MQTMDIVSIIVNVGFPALCFILIRSVSKSLGKKFNSLDTSLKRLVKTIQSIK